MAAVDDDPFSTPSTASQPTPMLSLPSSSPAQIRRQLEAQLAETRKRLETAAQLGRDLVEQEKTISERLEDLQEAGDDVDPELKQKLAELEKEYNDVGRGTARALLTNKIMGSAERERSPLRGGVSNLSTPSSLQAHGSGSPSKLGVPSSRRQRNQPSRHNDLEFATELGQGLIAEVRKLQVVLAETEEQLKNVKAEKENLEQYIENLEARIKALDESEQRYKEENWNLELTIQELRAESTEQKETESRLTTQLAVLTHEKNIVIKELDETKDHNAQITQELNAKYKQHDGEVAQLRRHLAATEADRETLQKKVEDLKMDLDEAQKINLRLRLQEQRAASAEHSKDPLDLSLPDEDTPEHSPPPSPVKHTPRHNTALESETLKSSLHHAHRMITSLKSNIHREKTEKAELKRLLQEAREEIEAARSNFGTPSTGTAKRRKPDGTFRRTQKNNVMLGGGRKSRDEIHMVENTMDDEWEEAGDSPEGPSRRGLGVFGLGTNSTGESAFETANEKDTSTEAFETANETEASRTGAESPVNDNPTSADDMTETETHSTMSGRTLRARSSHGSSMSSRSVRRNLRLSRSRHRMDSVVSVSSTASTDDEAERYLQPAFEEAPSSPPAHFAPEELNAPSAISSNNPRLKLRINRNRRSSRISDTGLFSNTAFADVIGSSPPSMSDGSPIYRPTGIRKSLFAELGDSPGMMSTEDETDADDHAGMGTPTKKANYYQYVQEPVRPQMMDCGMNTEVPYPEIPMLVSEDTEHERPRTAATVSSDATTLMHEPLSIKRSATPAMSDVGVQSDEEPKKAMSEMGTQSDEPVKDEPVMAEMATQSDEPVKDEPAMAEMGTQSDVELPAPEEPKPVLADMGTQSDVPDSPPLLPMLDVGTQFDAELESEHVLAPSRIAKTVAAPVTAGIAGLAGLVGLQAKGESEEQTNEEAEEFTKPQSNTITPIRTVQEIVPQIPEPVVEEKTADRNAHNTVFIGTTADIVPVEPVVEKTADQNKRNTVFIGTTADIVPIEPVVEQPVVAAPVIAPAVPLELSEIRALATTPVEPKSSSTTALVPIPAPVPVVVDGNRSSDDDTPRKVSDNVEETRAAELTPERKGFFASLFNSNKTETVRGRLSRTPSMASMASSTRSRASSVVRVFSPESQSTPTSATKSKGSDQYLQIGEAGDQEETIRKKDTRRPRPTLPVPVMDQMIQTEISSDYVDQLEKEIAETKKALSAVGSADFTRPLSPSLRSRPSQDSIPRSRSRDGVIRVGAPTVVRPTSSSSMRGAAAQHPPLPFNHQEQIAAATHHQPTSAPAYQSLLLETPSKSVMGPPPVPVFRSTTTPSNATRPRTPLTHETTSTATTAINRGRPETPSRAGATPRARFSSVRSSDLSSPASRRSSLSSFASELDGRFNMDNPAIFNGHPNPSGTGTDPKVIQAITQTMIGEYLWKYTRQKGRKDLSSSRHRRFFWVHPYTRTLYWSDRDPQTAGRAELRAKSVSIEAVKVVTDDNPMPPGLHRRSIIVITPGRIIKFTAPTGARHEMWFSALSYLLLRTGEHPGDDVNGAIDEEELSDCGASPASNGGGVYNGRNSMRGASGSFASYSTPSRNTSSLSNRRPGESSTRLQGSMSRLSNIFRPASGFGNYGSRTASGQYNYGTSDFGESNDEDDFGHDHPHDHREGIENVRACCDGRHDVSTLSRRGGKKSFNSYRSGRKSVQHQQSTGSQNSGSQFSYQSGTSQQIFQSHSKESQP